MVIEFKSYFAITIGVMIDGVFLSVVLFAIMFQYVVRFIGEKRGGILLNVAIIWESIRQLS